MNLEIKMKVIRKVFVILFILFNCTSCINGGSKLKKTYASEEELIQDIEDAINIQYGLKFEICNGLDNGKSRVTVGDKYGFYGYLRPFNLSDSYKDNNIYTDYTVCNYTGTFKTQAHVRMFEEQLRDDVNSILNDIGINYDIIEFRGMDREYNKWSVKDSYDDYRKSKDYETWIYIKLEKNLEKKDYPKYILPILKKIYTALEPGYNPTLLFYLDNYHSEYYDKFENKWYVEDVVNPVALFLDLSKYNNYLEWTENDIEMEISILHEEWFITAWKKANGLE